MRRGLIVLIAATAALVPAAQAQADACVSNADGNWSAPGTWTSCGGGIPTSGDSAAIISPHDVTVDAAQTVTDLNLSNGGVIQFTTGNPTLAVTGSFGTSGGVISGNGTITVAGAFTQSSIFSLTVQEGADLVLNGASSLVGAQITTSDQGGGDPSVQINATLTIADGTGAGPTAIGTFAGGDVPHVKVGASGQIVDDRTGDTTIQAPYDNDGTVVAQSGQLLFSSGMAGATSTGDFTATAGDRIKFEFGGTVGSGGSLQGAGEIIIGNVGLTAATGADVTVATLTLDGGNLTISGTGLYTPTTINVTFGGVTSTRNTSPTTLNAQNGAISGDHTVTPTTFTKTTGGQFGINNQADLVLNQAATITQGDICLADGGGGDPTLQVNATLTIASTVTPTTPICHSEINTLDGPKLLIGANGKIVDQQPGPTRIIAPYDNEGEIRADADGLELTVSAPAGFVSGGDFRAEALDTLTFQGAPQIGGVGASLQGPGEIGITGGTTSVTAGADVTPGTLTVNGGSLGITGGGLYTPTTINVTFGNIASSRSASPTTLNAAFGGISDNHTLTVATFNKTTSAPFSISNGADLVLDGTATFFDGTICVDQPSGADPSLQINTTLLLPAAVPSPLNCAQGQDDVPHVFVGPGGLLSRGAAGSSTIATRTQVNGGTVEAGSGETLEFTNVPLELTTGGVLTGTGTIGGAGVTNTSGTVRPGASPGTLTIDGPFTQGSGGTLGIEVDGDQAGQFDVLDVSGAATLAGTVAADVGYDPADDDVIPFLTSGSRSGTFDSLTGADLGGGRAFSLDYPAADPFGARLVVDLPPTPTAGQPSINGTPASGQTLTCDPGTWGGNPDFAFAWLRDGQPIDGATQSTYTVTDDDRGHELTCRVTGTNASGGAQATSAPVTVPAPSSPPPPPATTATDPPATTPPPATPPPTTTVAPTPQEERLAAAAPSAVAKALGLPARACLSRRRFAIRVREPVGVRIASVRITVAGKRVTARRRNGRWTATVDLRGLKRGRYAVRIVARTASGKTLTGTRRYRTCGTKRRAGGVPEL